LGLGVPETLTDVGVIGKPGYFLGKCSNGYSFEYRDPDYKPDPKPDDNTTKPDNPDPQPDPDNPQPDPGGDSGGGGNSGGGNNGGSQDNPNPNPGGGSGDNPKPNPNPGGGSGGGGNGNNKDDDPKFDLDKEFNFSDISDSYNGFFSESKSKIESIIGEFNIMGDSINQLKENIKGNGFENVKPQIKNKCPIKKQILLPNGSSKEVTVDYCDIFFPVSEITYYVFYIFFFVGSFILLFKILMLSL